MKHLVVALLFVVACSKSKDAPATAGSSTGTTTGSAEPVAKGSDTGSAMAGSAATGSGSAAVAAGSGSAAGSGEAGEAKGSGGFDFDKLTTDEKKEFMKTKVMPAMKEAFQKFDAKKYANFDCKTCHGKKAKETKFKMPNPELPKLDFVALKAGKQAPKVAEFMGKVVKPEMAKILQQPEYTESNPKGFGCLECHEQKK